MHIAIIGNGISGTTAARFLRKYSHHRITMISAESEYFFARTGMMYAFMGHLRFSDLLPYENWFWKKNKIDLVFDHVTRIDVLEKRLYLKRSPEISYDKLIIATGSKVNMPDIPGTSLHGVTGFYHKGDLENITNLHRSISNAVIIGGGLIGIELAEMFHSKNIPVTMVVRDAGYWRNTLPYEESEMVGSLIKKQGIKLLLNTEVREIQGNAEGKVKSVVLTDDNVIECDFVGIATGVLPQISLLNDTGIETEKGILVDEYLQTNNPDIFAAGDCAQIRSPDSGRKSIEPVWYTGRIMGELVANNICRNPVKYKPGIWFNSAKFFGMEYQVYGFVPNKKSTEYDNVFWQHPDTQKSVRIMYEQSTEKVVGFGLMGIRYRHEVCEKWILEETQLSTVLADLSLANFDPEFFRQYEPLVLEQYFQQTGKKILPAKAKNLNAVIKFLKNVKR